MNEDRSFESEPVVVTKAVRLGRSGNGIGGWPGGRGSILLFIRIRRSATFARNSVQIKPRPPSFRTQIADQNNALSGTVSDLQSQLSTAQQNTTQSIAKVQDAAKRHADVVADNVAKTLEQKNAERQAAINEELAGVKNAAADSVSQMSSKIDGVGASVDSVKTDLASTKAVADKTASDLQRATGDMGVMSGLIATNENEIQELRALGDRNIYEFTITKKAGLQKVGDVQIRLTKVDDKHNRYTMVVMADDKLVEKERQDDQRTGTVLHGNGRTDAG